MKNRLLIFLSLVLLFHVFVIPQSFSKDAPSDLINEPIETEERASSELSPLAEIQPSRVEEIASYLAQEVGDRMIRNHNSTRWMSERFELIYDLYNSDIDSSKKVEIEKFIERFSEFAINPEAFLRWFWIPALGRMSDIIKHQKDRTEQAELKVAVRQAISWSIRINLSLYRNKSAELAPSRAPDFVELIFDPQKRKSMKRSLAKGEISFMDYFDIVVAESIIQKILDGKVDQVKNNVTSLRDRMNLKAEIKNLSHIDTNIDSEEREFIIEDAPLAMLLADIKHEPGSEQFKKSIDELLRKMDEKRISKKDLSKLLEEIGKLHRNVRAGANRAKKAK